MYTQETAEIWNILTALRGPDLSPFLNVKLKEVFTIRIRYFFFRIETIPFLVKATPRIHEADLAFVVQKLYNLKRKGHGVRHFLTHTARALNTLIELGLLTEEEQKEAAFLARLAEALTKLTHGNVFELKKVLKEAPPQVLDSELFKTILEKVDVQLYFTLFEVGEENAS